MEESAAHDAARASDPQAAGAVSSPSLTPDSGGERHLRLLHAALSVADSARREAERDNARLRAELQVLQEHLARVLACAAAARTVVGEADENCGVDPPPADAHAPLKPPVRSDTAAVVSGAAAPDARRALVPAQQSVEVVRLRQADDPSDAREELLRRRATALGLAGSALFPKAMHRV